MAAQTGQSCRLDQSRSWLLQRDIGAKLAADALLPPIWLVRVPRVRLIAETLFAQPTPQRPSRQRLSSNADSGAVRSLGTLIVAP